MRIPSASAANPGSVPSFGQRQRKTSSAAYATKQAASASPAQRPAASNSNNQVQGTYSIDQMNLPMLLSSQGATIIPPELQFPSEPSASQPHSNSVTFAVTSGGAASNGPPAALEEATQIMDSLGSNGVLSLANVESAEHGFTTPSAGNLLNSNTDADTTADFTRLSGGASSTTLAQLTKMTLAQLTGVMQNNANPQNQYPDSYGKVVMSGASTATSTTSGVPNAASPPASASSKARTVALAYLW